ncbi:MAG: hypothetical protein ACXWRE_07335 [Pseudobdellovibrionaceae bacterium]
MEKFCYEYRPHSYILLSLWTYFHLGDSRIAIASSMALMLSGLLVFQMRYVYRRRFK